jgi:pimeloyl-ACP methyl ester carboxylesterase
VSLREVREAPSDASRRGRGGRDVVTTYVLVHGAWSGAHGFRHVRKMLAAEGHEVYTPSLTGLGERVHLASPQVTLSTHVQDVVNHVLYEDHSEIVLLGYSYGGMVVTGSLEYLADRVAHLVYLDAFVPHDGESIDSLGGGRLQSRSMIGLDVDWLTTGIGGRVFDDPEEEAWSLARRTRHPLGCFLEGVRLPDELETYPFTRTYIKATGDGRPEAGGHFWDAADRATGDPDHWRYREVKTNHMIPANRPRECADLLLELA